MHFICIKCFFFFCLYRMICIVQYNLSMDMIYISIQSKAERLFPVLKIHLLKIIVQCSQII